MARITSYATASEAAGHYLVVDDTTAGTKKLPTNDFLTLVVSSAAFSELPQTLANSNITPKHVVVNSVLSDPSAQTGDWTVTTSAGSVEISGSISGSTAITLYLAEMV